MALLTKETGPKKSSRLLTTQRDVGFVLCFKYPLEKKYSFTELEKQNNKEFQGFLDKVSKMTVQQVDQAFARKPDKNDTYNGLQVYHYAITDSFRIHVVNEAGHYVVIRLDPHHKVHK